jgi:hypothetical protein
VTPARRFRQAPARTTAAEDLHFLISRYFQHGLTAGVRQNRRCFRKELPTCSGAGSGGGPTHAACDRREVVIERCTRAALTVQWETEKGGAMLTRSVSGEEFAHVRQQKNSVKRSG